MEPQINADERRLSRRYWPIRKELNQLADELAPWDSSDLSDPSDRSDPPNPQAANNVKVWGMECNANYPRK